MTGSEFRKRREKIGLTQAGLAKLFEVTETTIYRWESNKAPILKTVQLALKQIEYEQTKGRTESDGLDS